MMMKLLLLAAVILTGCYGSKQMTVNPSLANTERWTASLEEGRHMIGTAAFGPYRTIHTRKLSDSTDTKNVSGKIFVKPRSIHYVRKEYSLLLAGQDTSLTHFFVAYSWEQEERSLLDLFTK